MSATDQSACITLKAFKTQGRQTVDMRHQRHGLSMQSHWVWMISAYTAPSSVTDRSYACFPSQALCQAYEQAKACPASLMNMYNVIPCALQGLAWLPMCHPNFFRSFGLPAMATFGLMMHQCGGNSVSKAARMLHKTCSSGDLRDAQ